MVATDDAALASTQMAPQASSSEADHDGPAPLMEDAEASREAPAGVEDAPAAPEEPKETAKAAVTDSRSADQIPEDADADTDAAGTLTAGYSAGNGSQPEAAEPAPGDGEMERDNLPAEEDSSEEEETAPADETADGTADEPAAAPPAPDPAEPESPEDDVEPVEIVNAPEQGILIAYSGGVAQNWVEQALGLEWAAGGSYSLSAEQYVQLLTLLDEAGEPYRIEPGGGYCLMSE